MRWGYGGPDGEEHTGHAAFMTRDGRSSGTSNASGALFESARTRQAVADADAAGRTPTPDDMYDLVPWDELLGWHTTCSCGWTGSTSGRAVTLNGEHGGQADNAQLPGGSTVADAAYAQWRRHLERIK